MTVAYVTMPGTSGNYVSSADVNLLDADTAHLHQLSGTAQASIGRWARSQHTAVNGLSIVADGGTLGNNSLHLISNGSAGWSRMAATFLSSFFTGLTLGTDTLAWWFDVEVVSGPDSFDVIIDWGAGAGANRYQDIVVNGSAAAPLTGTGVVPAGADHTGLGIVLQQDVDAAVREYRLRGVCAQIGSSPSFVPSVRIVGDLDMRARFVATTATPAAAKALIGQRSGNSGYAMTLGTGGELVVYHGTGAGTRLETSSGLTLVAATDTVVRSVIDISAGTWTHYKNGVQFDTSGSFATTAGSPFAGPLAVGADSAGTSGNWAGDIYYCEVRDGIDGPVVRRVDADDLIGLV